MFESLAVVSQDLQALTSVAKKQFVDEKGSQKIDQIVDNTDVLMKDARQLLSRTRKS